MQETRRLRLQSAIQEELSQFIPREVKDPRIPMVTFTDVQVTQDGSHAVVFVAILGAGLMQAEAENAGASDAELAVAEQRARQRMQACLEGLTAASGFVRRHLGRVLTVRHIPTLAFKEDRGFENATRVQELLHKLQSETKKS